MTTEVNQWAPGTVIDGVFKIKEMIGYGGMGAVFRAHHLEWNLDLAVKVLHSEAAENLTYQEGFLREATTWVSLGTHPNIVQCWFVRECNGVPALFLDYLIGGSLDDWLEEGNLAEQDWGKMLDIIIQTADGLAHAHSHGVIHRDIKPANLLIRGDDRLCVTDFGLVKLQNAPEGAEPEALLLGTPKFAAPEQWDENAEVTPAADMYSLGVVFYWLLTGRFPFVREEGEDDWALIDKHSHQEPDPPVKFRPDIPQELNYVVLTCLEKKPEKRPPSMVEFRRFLAETYQRITGQPYPRPEPATGLQRAYALNNRAVSLYNLARADEALDLWNQALHLDGQHPETVYNRSTVLWRRGQLAHADVVSRLKRVGSAYYLGLFLIESRDYEGALETLRLAVQEPELVESGFAHRALGDALKYTGANFGAEQAYARALTLIPEDERARRCRRMARLGLRAVDDHIQFPMATPAGHLRLHGPPRIVKFEPRLGWLVAAGDGWVEGRDLGGGLEGWSKPLDSPLRKLEVHGYHVLAYQRPPQEIWSIRNGEVQWESNDPIVMMSQEAALAVTADQLLDLSGKRVARLAVENPLVTGVFRCDGGEFYATDAEGKISIFEISGRILGQLDARSDPPRQLLKLTEQPVVIGVGRAITYWHYSEGASFILSFERTVTRAELDDFERYLLVHLTPTEGQPDYEVRKVVGGEKLLEGHGPACFTPEGDLLTSVAGQLRLWSLEYGHRVRDWEPHGQQLISIGLDFGGLHAITVSSEGGVSRWELDEAHRMGHKELLLNRGRSHVEEEMTRSKFQEQFQSARRHFQEGSHALAYRTLQTARNVRGYARDDSALALLSALGEHLHRTGLSEVWERHSVHLKAAPEELETDFASLTAYLRRGPSLASYSFQESRARGLTREGVVCVGGGHPLWLGGPQGQLFQLDGPQLFLPSTIQVLRIDATGKFGMAAAEDGKIYLIDLQTGQVLLDFEDQVNETRVVATTPDFRYGLTGPNFSFWELANAKRLLKARHLKPEQKLPKEALDMEAMALSREGDYAFTGCSDFLLRLWDTRTGRCMRVLDAHSANISFVYLWSHLRAAASASTDGLLLFWDLDTGAILERIETGDGPLLCQASPDGRFLVSLGRNAHLRLWELEWSFDHERAGSGLKESVGKSGALDRIGSFFRGR